MLNKKVIIGFIIALIALIVIGFVALHFVPNGDLTDLNVGGNVSNVTANSTINITDNPIESVTNVTENNDTAVNENATDDANDTNSSSDDIDAGDVLHKQTFTITGNETGQNEGMEPGTYVMYYTENDGIIKVDKID